MDNTEKRPYGVTEDGRAVTLYRIGNNAGSYIEVLDYGCTLLGMYVRQRDGQMRNVIAGSFPGLGQAADNPLGVMVRGGWRVPLERTVWTVGEGPDDAVVFSAQAQEQGSQLSCQVSFRMKDFDRLVIDYEARAVPERPVWLSHRVEFLLDGSGGLHSHKMRAFAPCVPAAPAADGMEYGPVPEGRRLYAAAGAEIHPFVELAADSTDLALTAYSTMSGMEMQTLSGAAFTACPASPEEIGGVWKERTVYGIDLLYHAGDGLAANPFMFFPGK